MKDWLKTQKAYQEGVYGVHFGRLWVDNEIVDYLSTMLTAAQIEVAEAYQEVPWKPWAQLSPDQRTDRLAENSEKVVGELVDVLFFVANALVALGMDDGTLQLAYDEKMGVNRTRQETGYDAISTKCARCGRALDEPHAAAPVVGASGKKYCSTICELEADDVADDFAEPDVTVEEQPPIPAGHVSCPGCGRTWAPHPLELIAVGVDGRAYCGTQCCVKVTGHAQASVRDGLGGNVS